MKRFERHERRRQSVYEERENKRLASWNAWREKVLSEPAHAFTPDSLIDTISRFHEWLSAYSGGQSDSIVWNRKAIEQAFSVDIAQQAALAFKSVWRTNPPATSWKHCFCGLAVEAETLGWAKQLSPDEARVAVSYATGHTPWLLELAEAYPSILGEELSAELALRAEEHYLPILQNLSYTDNQIKRLFAPYCHDALKRWHFVGANEMYSRCLAHNLENLFRIVDELTDKQDRSSVAADCESRFFADPAGPLSLVWLEGLFRFDAQRGTIALERHIASLEDAEQTERATKIFADLFGNRDSSLLKFEDSPAGAETLKRLIIHAHSYVREKDDQRHDDVFSPDTRDDAQTGRDFLFSVLLDTPGSNAYSVKLELASNPLFSNYADRFRFLIREKAAKDTEFEAYTASDIAALDRDGLFKVMKNRLEDFTHEIAHDDFTNRKTLCAITEECEIQRTLALWLKYNEKNAYVVTREPEKADAKRTDIQLNARHGNQKAEIEIKLADNWSGNELENALRNQLVGQYLRHETSSVGCLLLTYHGRKGHWEHPKTGKNLTFPEIINYLADIGREIELEHSYDIRLFVHGINFIANVAPK